MPIRAPLLVSVTDDGLANDSEPARRRNDERPGPGRVGAPGHRRSRRRSPDGRRRRAVTATTASSASWRADGGAGTTCCRSSDKGCLGASSSKAPTATTGIGGAGDDLLTSGPGADVVRGGEDATNSATSGRRRGRCASRSTTARATDPAGETTTSAPTSKTSPAAPRGRHIIGSGSWRTCSAAGGQRRHHDGRGGDGGNQGAASHLIGGTGRDGSIRADGRRHPTCATAGSTTSRAQAVAMTARAASATRSTCSRLPGHRRCEHRATAPARRARHHHWPYGAYGRPVCRGVMTLRLADVAGSSVSARFVLRPGTGKPIQ